MFLAENLLCVRLLPSSGYADCDIRAYWVFLQWPRQNFGKSPRHRVHLQAPCYDTQSQNMTQAPFRTQLTLLRIQVYPPNHYLVGPLYKFAQQCQPGIIPSADAECRFVRLSTDATCGLTG
ncbi:hypothetical protein B0H17DRAFT_708227 [Mycena rosella]|uniref:Uncharacterized protein n=1 Tax=Mycena rosella TaxID=1033263 RepID=A0AAD7GFP5_MYCRO|nr:hypothetical protein B0H17DRAFT_708227 [Mycena rosella]